MSISTLAIVLLIDLSRGKCFTSGHGGLELSMAIMIIACKSLNGCQWHQTQIDRVDISF